MPSDNDPPVKKVRPAKLTPKKKVPVDEEQKDSDGPSGGKNAVQRKHDEIVLAETRTAKPTDDIKRKGDEDPAELLGMGKIGALPKGEWREETKKEEPQEEPKEEPAVPEPTIEEAVQEDTFEETPDEETETPERLPPPPIPKGAKELKPPQDLLADDTAQKEQEVELKEVAIGRDGRKIKVLSVKPMKLPPPTDEEATSEPSEGKEPAPTGGIRDLSTGEDRVQIPTGRVRRSAGLGVDVELDPETIKKLSAPMLPALFGYPKRAFHSRFRRYILFFMVPTVFLALIFYLGIVTLLMELLVGLIFLVVLGGFIVYGLSPFYTCHMVTKTNIILKHGIYFEARIPLSEVRTAKVYEDQAGVMGIRFDRDRRLFALSDRKDMVEIVLKEPTTVASRHNVESVVTNVEEPNVFIKTVKGAVAAQAEEF